MTKCCMVVAKDPTAHPATLTDPDNTGSLCPPLCEVRRNADRCDTGYVNLRGLSRKHIFAAVDASLERLGMDYIDLFQCHRFDYDTPIEETMDALDAVVSPPLPFPSLASRYSYRSRAGRFATLECRRASRINSQRCRTMPRVGRSVTTSLLSIITDQKICRSKLCSSRCKISTTQSTEKKSERCTRLSRSALLPSLSIIRD